MYFFQHTAVKLYVLHPTVQIQCLLLNFIVEQKQGKRKNIVVHIQPTFIITFLVELCQNKEETLENQNISKK